VRSTGDNGGGRECALPAPESDPPSAHSDENQQNPVVQPDHPVTQIDAPYNIIRFIPRRLDHLESLDLSDNELYVLGDQLQDADFTFNSLRKLRLSSNHLREIPPSVFHFPALKELYLDKNSLSAISGELPNIATLDLFINSLSQFPNLPDRIVSVNLGFNQIKFLSMQLPNLRELKLSGNDLPEVSDCLFPSLVLLARSFNRLVSLPPIASFAPKLEHMILSFNFLSSFLTNFPVSIKKIEISHNCMSQ
jgi:Leucine-rich repeat (LRR) protein